ncbi:MAG: hypothetical protein HY902_11670 [Deltaproteobacteria bacterium]|nr:hypothetical protein [Deltaproteobacteria bacterium]
MAAPPVAAPAIATAAAVEPAPAAAAPEPVVRAAAPAPAEHKPRHHEKAAEPKVVEKASEPGRGTGKGCSAAEGSREWCTGCSKAQNLTPSSKNFCPCLVAQGQTTGLTYYCKCVFPKEDHKIGSPAFCRCNPRDPTCQHE